MAKLKNYEIDAIFNKLHAQIEKIKEEKLNTIKANVKLDDKDNMLLALIEEYNLITEKKEALYKTCNNLAREIFDIKDYVYFDFKSINTEKIIKHKANKMLPENLRDTAGNLRDRIVLANIDGNVQELIDSILAEYND